MNVFVIQAKLFHLFSAPCNTPVQQLQHADILPWLYVSLKAKQESLLFWEELLLAFSTAVSV